jgi:glutaryl-CoA dehydrogenase
MSVPPAAPSASPHALPAYDVGRSLSTDYFGLKDQLTEDELALLLTARAFVDDEVLPVIGDFWERAEFPRELAKRMGELGLVGDGITGPGCPPMTATGSGLVNMEVNRGDGSLGTFLGVQSGLAMKSIDLLGSDEQKARWLPGLAAVDLFGAFALTEPTHGSDSVALETSARRDGSDYVLNGAKRWIGNAPSPTSSSSGPATSRTARSRASWSRAARPASTPAGWRARSRSGRSGRPTSPSPTCASRPTPAARSATFKDTGRVLASTRSSVAWGALGHATAAYEVALAYAGQREQFGKPLSSFQLVQDKLVRMLAEVTAMQLYCMRLARLSESGQLTDTISALAKLNNTRKAREVILEARELLGGNGILLDFHVVRHMADIEAIYTYEGTADIQELIVGRKITGQSAFT